MNAPVNVDPRTIPANQLPARDITIRAGLRDFYRQQFARFGLNFDLLPNYPDKLVNPRSQVVTFGAEREFFRGLFFGADYVHQHWSNLDRTVDLNAPTPIDRAIQPTRTVAQANNTRPILPANGGVRQVNVILGWRITMVCRLSSAIAGIGKCMRQSATLCPRRRIYSNRTAMASVPMRATSVHWVNSNVDQVLWTSAIAQ